MRYCLIVTHPGIVESPTNVKAARRILDKADAKSTMKVERETLRNEKQYRTFSINFRHRTDDSPWLESEIDGDTRSGRSKYRVTESLERWIDRL